MRCTSSSLNFLSSSINTAASYKCLSSAEGAKNNCNPLMFPPSPPSHFFNWSLINNNKFCRRLFTSGDEASSFCLNRSNIQWCAFNDLKYSIQFIVQFFENASPQPPSRELRS